GGRPPSTAMQAPPTHRPIEQGVPSATRLAVSHIQLVGGTSQVQYPAVQHSGGHAVTPSAHRLVRRGGAPTVRPGSATSGGRRGRHGAPAAYRKQETPQPKAQAYMHTNLRGRTAPRLEYLRSRISVNRLGSAHVRVLAGAPAVDCWAPSAWPGTRPRRLPRPRRPPSPTPTTSHTPATPT